MTTLARYTCEVMGLAQIQGRTPLYVCRFVLRYAIRLAHPTLSNFKALAALLSRYQPVRDVPVLAWHVTAITLFSADPCGG